METCAHTIEGPKADTGGGRLRPWWRRRCRRRPTVGRYCWQHASEHPLEQPPA